MYNTCRSACRYCYANYNAGTVDANFAMHDPHSPLILGKAGEDDVICEREMISCRDSQVSLSDL